MWHIKDTVWYHKPSGNFILYSINRVSCVITISIHAMQNFLFRETVNIYYLFPNHGFNMNWIVIWFLLKRYLSNKCLLFQEPTFGCTNKKIWSQSSSGDKAVKQGANKTLAASWWKFGRWDNHPGHPHPWRKVHKTRQWWITSWRGSRYLPGKEDEVKVEPRI